MFAEFQNFVSGYDFIFVCETKLYTFDLISIPNYTFLHKPRKQKYERKSGLSVFVQSDLIKYINIIESESEYVMLV